MRQTSCTIAGSTYTLRPLTLGALRDLQREGHLETINDQKHPKYYDALISVLSACLMRSHPQCDEKWVAENVDLVDLVDLYVKALRLSVPPGEGDGGKNAESP